MSNKGDISKRQPLAEKQVRMHSAEHILTAVMHRLFASPRNLEMHLGEKKSKCDYTVSSVLTPQEIENIERAVNAEIEKDYQITTEVLPIEEAKTTYNLWKVPPGVATIRIVKIGNIDATPCSSEHVSHTNQIGRFRIKSYTMREENVVRIRFGLEDILLIRSAQDGCPREFTTKSTKDAKNGIRFKLQHPQPVEYKGVCLDCSYRVDLPVEDKLIIELKSVEQIKGTLPQGHPRAPWNSNRWNYSTGRGAVAALHEAGGGEDRTPDELQCHLGGCSKQDRLLHPPSLKAVSSALSFDSFALFVFFVVKQFVSLREFWHFTFSLVTHSKSRAL